jgi:hypothetical protein
MRDLTTRPIVLGGLVPEVLTSGQEPDVPEHQGTTDVDLHVSVEVPAQSEWSGLESALQRAGFAPDPKSVGGWQWNVKVESVTVRVDFLCDDSGQPAEHVIPMTKTLGVLNLRGTGYVLEDFTTRSIAGELPSGRSIVIDARFAGLGGYLLSKCVSAVTRQKPKDFYDLAYVLLYNRAGGPQAAASTIRDGALSKHLVSLKTTLRELHERYREPTSLGSRSFADLHELAAPGGDRPRLAQDAVAAVKTFVDSLVT